MMEIEIKDKNHMGTVTIQNRTTIDPITCIGEEAGICWGANVEDKEANYKRGVDCIKCNHGRTMEFPEIYMILNNYSSKVIREFYTHIIGVSRLQSSTRYIDYSKKFENVIPESVKRSEEATNVWNEFMDKVAPTISKLKELGVPTEDATNVLPLAYETKVVVKLNLRALVNISEMRMCNRAYWEFRQLMKDILWALENYSDEWEEIIYGLKLFAPRCEKLGYCPERKGCGRKGKKED